VAACEEVRCCEWDIRWADEGWFGSSCVCLFGVGCLGRWKRGFSRIVGGRCLGWFFVGFGGSDVEQWKVGRWVGGVYRYLLTHGLFQALDRGQMVGP